MSVFKKIDTDDSKTIDKEETLKYQVKILTDDSKTIERNSKILVKIRFNLNILKERQVKY